MEAESKIWFSKSVVESVLQQRACAGTDLLCRLRYKHDRAVPLVFYFCQCARGADERRNVHVMSTGVHNMNVLTFVVFGDDLAGVRQTSLFLHWQRIHVCAHKYRRPVTILYHSHHSVTPELGIFVFSKMLCDLAARRA